MPFPSSACRNGTARLFLGVAVLVIAAVLAVPESVFYPLNRHTAVMSAMFLELY